MEMKQRREHNGLDVVCDRVGVAIEHRAFERLEGCANVMAQWWSDSL